MAARGSATERRFVNLALQGGGSHGAFTWGVLDRLLEDERFDIEAVSGTSAGAINAITLAHGYAKGGPAGAKAALDQLWTRIGELGEWSPLRRSLIDRWFGSWGVEFNPAYLAFDVMSRLTSPYQFNPSNVNPLRAVLDDIIDWPAVRKLEEFKLFISATNVRTGRVRVFEQQEITCDMVLASTCLPFMFQAVEINGEHYWDGGYVGNPALFPLFYICSTRDILIVQINPIERPGVPLEARDILERVNEISFNSSLLQELRSIEFVGRLLDEGRIDHGRYKKMLVHIIDGGGAMLDFGAASKLNAEADFLTHLKSLGRAAADAWIPTHFDSLGKTSTVDLASLVKA